MYFRASIFLGLRVSAGRRRIGEVAGLLCHCTAFELTQKFAFAGGIRLAAQPVRFTTTAWVAGGSMKVS